MEVCSIGEPRDTQRHPARPSVALHTLVTKKQRLALPSSHNDSLSYILYRNNDKSSRQIFHVVLVETPICVTKRRTGFTRLLANASSVAMTDGQMCQVYVPSQVYITFLASSNFNNPVESVSLWYNTNTGLYDTVCPQHKNCQKSERIWYQTLPDLSLLRHLVT